MTLAERRRLIRLVFWTLLCSGMFFSLDAQVAVTARSTNVRTRITQPLQTALQKQELKLGAPLFIRIFKQEKVLELWVEQGDSFKLFKSYPICYYSGNPGPKLRQGDLQSPEGFYSFGSKALNPWSRFHLSINLGYPNEYDRTHKRTGNYLMIHGDCVSIGCYAMTNPSIEEIYTLAWHALESGQSTIRVHIYPFRLTEQNLETHRQSRWIDFWNNLKQGYDYFERHKSPPNVLVRDKRYIVEGD